MRRLPTLNMKMGARTEPVGAALAFGGFIILLHAGIYGIADLLSEAFNVPQLWIASLIVGGGFLIIGLAVLKHVTHRV